MTAPFKSPTQHYGRMWAHQEPTKGSTKWVNAITKVRRTQS